MHQFSFRATDRLGNTIDGSVAAADHAAAIAEIQRMGYTPLGVQLAGTIPASAAPAPQATPAVSSSRPRPVDLTQPVVTMPDAAYDLYASSSSSSAPEPTVQMMPISMSANGVDSSGVGVAAFPGNGSEGIRPGAEEVTARMERLEPWERVTPDLNVTQPLQGDAATMARMQAPRHRVEIIRGLEKIPFGSNSSRVVELPQRIREVLLYPLFSGVKLKELAQWYRQLATLIGAGLNFNQSLVALADNTKNPRLKAITEDAVRQVRAGGYFSDVVAAYPWIFPPMHLEMLRAAEHGGMLEDTLVRVGDYVEHEMEVKRLISKETLYPKIVMFVLLMLMGRSGIFGHMPAIAALFVSGNMHQYLMDTIVFGLAILVPVLLVVAFFRLFLFNNAGVRNTYDEVKIKLPVIGKIVRYFAIGKFARTYAALSKAGFPTSSALQIAGDASGNVTIARAGHHAALRAEQGFLPSQALAETRRFTSMAIDMLRTAETSGSVDEMMDKVADYHEQEAKSATYVVAMIFSVGVFLIVALIVGASVIGQYQGYAHTVGNAGNASE